MVLLWTENVCSSNYHGVVRPFLVMLNWLGGLFRIPKGVFPDSVSFSGLKFFRLDIADSVVITLEQIVFLHLLGVGVADFVVISDK